MISNFSPRGRVMMIVALGSALIVSFQVYLVTSLNKSQINRIGPLASKGSSLEQDQEDHDQYSSKSKSKKPIPSLSILNSRTSEDNGACSALFPAFVSTTNAIWSSNLTRIIQASTDHDLPVNFITDMLQIVSPLQLQLGVHTLPRNYEPVQRAIEIVYARYKHVHSLDLANITTGSKNVADAIHDNIKISNESLIEPPPKLKILVMGGSVTAGVRCRELIDNPNNLDPKNRLFLRDFESQFDCAWPARLQHFINNIIGDVVEVRNVAVRGTDSSIGKTLLETNMIGPRPDIIINAFSTNDVGGKSFSAIQEFVRYVLRDEECQKPLLIHFFDVIPSDSKKMITVNRLAEKVHTLASYYGFGSVSYASVMRDVIYGDSAEYWFKPVGWNNRKKSSEEIHPQVGMHAVSAWTVGYYLLNLVTTYCSLEPEMQANATEVLRNHSANHKLSESLGTPRIFPGKPRLPPQHLPPVLTSSLTVGDLSGQWRTNETEDVKCMPIDEKDIKGCALNWVSGISTSPEKALEPFIVNNSGWSFIKDHGKLGLVPEGIKSTMTLEFHNSTHPIRSVTLMTMKSYGDRWTNSSVRVQAFEIQQNKIIEGFPLPIASIHVLGFHDSETSVSYKSTIPINIDAIKSSLQLTVELVGGSTAKIMGLTVCS